jgi:hypothetical protein
MNEHDDEKQPTDDQLDEVLERFASEHGAEIDEQRLAEMLQQIYDHARQHPRFGARVRGLVARGAHLFLTPVGESGNVECRLGFDDDPERWPKAHGKTVPLGRFPLSRILRRPEG